MLQKYINSRKKISEIEYYALCLSNVSKDITITNVIFFVEYYLIDTNDVLDIRRDLMKET